MKSLAVSLILLVSVLITYAGGTNETQGGTHSTNSTPVADSAVPAATNAPPRDAGNSAQPALKFQERWERRVQENIRVVSSTTFWTRFDLIDEHTFGNGYLINTAEYDASKKNDNWSYGLRLERFSVLRGPVRDETTDFGFFVKFNLEKRRR